MFIINVFTTVVTTVTTSVHERRSLSLFAGEQSLRKCFDYFEEVDVNCHKKFFRHLGINDNVIKGKEQLPYEDRIHELLNIWIEKEGIKASLNDLLKALLDLDQRLTAETIKENAVHHGHYMCVRIDEM